MTPDGLQLSATDLANHLACRHKTQLDLGHATGTGKRPVRADPAGDRLRDRGILHEQAYVEHLRDQGKQVVELNELEGHNALDRTRRAMEEGAEVIVQGFLAEGRWSGKVDLLLRSEERAPDGRWLYEVGDTKLASETRGTTLLQLCVYADLLTPIQGEPARRMHVIKPGEGFPTDTYRFAEFAAYYRSIRARMEEAATHDPVPLTYPEPVEHCDVCAWWPDCRKQRVDDDHLSLVADLQRSHARELESQGCTTLEALGSSERAIQTAPKHGREETFEKLRLQAEVQLAGRRSGQPEHQMLPLQDDRGLARLPEPTPGDLFLDFEGDPFVDGGGLEYLLGYADRSTYRALWGTTRREERHAFETFIDTVTERLTEHPGLHIYHFAPYEPSAMKRLASRHATRERELDGLLRGERFVDLHSILRQSLRASVERYSLKPLEAFFGYEREVDLREEASPALQRVQAALEFGQPETIDEQDRAHVEGYNRDDCLSLIHLQRWLEELRAGQLADGASLDRPPPGDMEESEGQEERADRIEQLYQELISGLDPTDREGWSEPEQLRWLLAHTLEYFQRELRVDYWEYHARRAAEEAEQIKDRKIIAGLEHIATVDRTKRGLPVDRYRFPPQEVSLGPGDEVQDVLWEDGPAAKLGEIEDIDLLDRTVDIRKTGATADAHPEVVHSNSIIRSKPLPGSLMDLAAWIRDHGIDSERPEHRAARDLLLRLPPRGANHPLRQGNEPVLDSMLRAATSLEGGVLAVQGPPGTGKSFTGARVILRLLRDGQRVGICAGSHKVIRSLIDKVLEAASEEKVPVQATQKVSKQGAQPLPPGLTEVTKRVAGQAAVAPGHLVGSTSWLWAHPDAEGCLDTLVVDEAGQLSLSYVLAIARSSRNLILLGDPQQLQQPARGAHPEGADVSALSHYLGGEPTMPPERGLFLDSTWRLHPSICTYTSELFYEDRLTANPITARQSLANCGPFTGSGPHFLPVPHEGNQSLAEEEVDTIAHLVAQLLQPSATWTDADGKTHRLTPDDIKVIAPYNLQVGALRRRLPDLSIGTVDKFQGQEAAVVIYSLTSSSAEEAPRGMGFLYDLNRLNVATSRGRAVCIVVGSPTLLEPECRTPEQMRLANALVRYREIGASGSV